MNKSSLGDSFTFCNLCRCDINIVHSGRDDLTKLVCVNELRIFSLILSFFLPFAGLIIYIVVFLHSSRPK